MAGRESLPVPLAETLALDFVTEKRQPPAPVVRNSQRDQRELKDEPSKKPTPSRQISGPPASRSGKPRELNAIERYGLELRQVLEQRKKYPPLARKLQQEGRVLVRFRLGADGRILEAEIIGKTEHDLLNRAARGLIQEVDGLKPLPMDLKKTSWDFVVPIEYRL